jgi:hypothetical protein
MIYEAPPSVHPPFISSEILPSTLLRTLFSDLTSTQKAGILAVVWVPVVSSFIVGHEIVSEHISLTNGTLCQHGYAVHILRSFLKHAVPVDGQFASKDVILKVYDDTVPQTYLCVSKLELHLEASYHMAFSSFVATHTIMSTLSRALSTVGDRLSHTLEVKLGIYIFIKQRKRSWELYRVQWFTLLLICHVPCIFIIPLVMWCCESYFCLFNRIRTLCETGI